MKVRWLNRTVLGIGLLAFSTLGLRAGPPFVTDDPEPVDYQHWEFYIASQDAKMGGDWSGTAPHFELNYGVVPDVQLHLIAPLAYDVPPAGSAHYGYGDTELGVKFRFIQETNYLPQVGIFPCLKCRPAAPGTISATVICRHSSRCGCKKAGDPGQFTAAAVTASIPSQAIKTGTLWEAYCKSRSCPTCSSARRSIINHFWKLIFPTAAPRSMSARSLISPNISICSSPPAVRLTARRIFSATSPGNSPSARNFSIRSAVHFVAAPR